MPGFFLKYTIKNIGKAYISNFLNKSTFKNEILDINIHKNISEIIKYFTLSEKIELSSFLLFSGSSSFINVNKKDHLETYNKILFLIYANIDGQMKQKKISKNKDLVENEILGIKKIKYLDVNFLEQLNDVKDVLSILYYNDFEDELLSQLKSRILPYLFQNNYLLEKLHLFSKPHLLLKEILNQSENNFISELLLLNE